MGLLGFLVYMSLGWNLILTVFVLCNLTGRDQALRDYLKDIGFIRKIREHEFADDSITKPLLFKDYNELKDNISELSSSLIEKEDQINSLWGKIKINHGRINELETFKNEQQKGFIERHLCDHE